MIRQHRQSAQDLKQKTLKAKKQECVVIFEQRSCFALVHFFWIFNNIIIVFACNCYVSFFLRVRITQTKKKTETIIDNHRSTSFLDGYEKKNGYEFHWNPKYMFYKKTKKAFGLMSGSCHFDRVSNDEFSVEYFLLCFLTMAEFWNLGQLRGIIRMH